ncbi:hypothetical protein BC938DRAFT_479716 [Jimgerdemannia flammicorona]|uniref:MSP domain-containing protein n=1 Tax=Jimgerdemannia flammicorona TaxID=994334 RepID=A0A433QKA1_9FUNG|nr:hypothetical protein BC938DRAFT_479716 [Jimgerdemannia flammicorona]
MKEDPSLDFKCKDKFLVQSVIITKDTDGWSLQELWSFAEKDGRDQIKEKKVKCQYLSPLGPDEDKNSYLAVPGIPSPSTSTSTSNTLTKQTSLNGLHDEFQAAAESYPDAARRNATRESLSEPQIFSNAPSSRPTSLINDQHDVLAAHRRSEEPVPSAAELARLRSELADARDAIKRMQGAIDNNERERTNDGLRQRQKGSAAGSVDPQTSIPGVGPQDAVHQVLAALKYPPPADGYPPQVVALVALIVFLVTWLFF